MPASKLKNRSLPASVLNNGSRQVNGLYVHSSPPKVLQINPKSIRQWIRLGDINQLEQIVLNGQGYKLIGESSPDPKVRNFLKQVPVYTARINDLHRTVAKGDLKQLQKLLETKPLDSFMKKISTSRNSAGVGLLHKAVYYGYPEIVQFLLSSFPQIVNTKDKDGKTPLHYCGASQKAGKIWPVLVRAGADQTILDSKGKPPSYYMARSNEIQMVGDRVSPEDTSSNSTDLAIKPSNIRIWIHDKDLGKLRQVIWEGHGGKLRVETSNNPRVRRFLEGVPHILNVIKDVHAAAVNNDLEEFVKKTSDPVPVEVLGSKDTNGLNPLHKAAGLGRLQIARTILEKDPKLVNSVDHEGKTPLHYAAVLKDNSVMYNFLTKNKADETAFDKSGKLPSYYRSNPKEINTKFLEVIPEAPRTAVAFPQTWDWMLFHPGGSAPSTFNSIPHEDIVKPSESLNDIPAKREDTPDISKLVPKPEILDENEVVHSEPEIRSESEVVHSEPKPQVNGTDLTEHKPVESPQQTVEEVVKEVEVQENEAANTNEGYDIWTNDEDGRSEKEDEKLEKEGENEEDGIEDDEDAEEPPPIESTNGMPENVNSMMEDTTEKREKTEREIAEERQRMLDEGLIKPPGDEEEISDEEKIKGIIQNGDIEALAAMVLNGDGVKLMGKTSNNPEIQTFLDNLPSYMAKIAAVHKAARSGSLKDLQGALDRRRFAVAKESSEKLGATPLHVAVLFGNTQIIKYLGGRFPETLNCKDKSGRTPLHYAATLPDNHIFDVLVNLGADQNVRDDDGHTPAYYQENPEALTKEKLLEELDHTEDNDVVSSPVTDPSVHALEPELSFDEGVPLSKSRPNDDSEEGNNGSESPQSNFSSTDRDEYGQSILHFAAARAYGRGGLFQLIQESNVNLGYRDELYRTARDIALQANIPENIYEIDKYVISLAARGETDKLIPLFLEGYDHILDIEDEEDNDIVTVASKKDHEKTIAFLKTIPLFEEKREKVHRAIRAGQEKEVQDVISESKNGRFLVIGKNSTGRCSLHVAVLCQQKEITEYIAQKYPETLKIGDNLERTALHYAMGVEEVETLSKILIKCGAKRVAKDLKGRQPTYYFMNRTEIIKLQEEEEILKK